MGGNDNAGADGPRGHQAGIGFIDGLTAPYV